MPGTNGRTPGSTGVHKADITSIDFYKFYRTQIEKNTVYDIPKKKFTDILKYINYEIAKRIVTENFEYSMSPRLGSISIKKFKTKFKLDEKGNLIKRKLPVDYGRTNALWKINPEAKKAKKLVYFLNDHSNGYRYKFTWDKSTCIVKNKSFYSFKASREHNRSIAVALFTIENLDYFEFNNNKPFKRTKV